MTKVIDIGSARRVHVDQFYRAAAILRALRDAPTREGVFAALDRYRVQIATLPRNLRIPLGQACIARLDVMGGASHA